jgi:chromosome segregation ATPase
MSRQRKTPAQRAQEALGVAQRRVTSITKKLHHAKEEVQTLEAELEEAELRLEYVQRNPDLPEQQTAKPAPTIPKENH